MGCDSIIDEDLGFGPLINKNNNNNNGLGKKEKKKVL